MTEDPVPLLLDANVVIDLVRLGVLADVARLPQYILIVVQEVKREVKRPEQAQVLADAIAAGTISETTIEAIEEEALHANLIGSIGKGEAACLAVAHCRGLALASGEVRPKFSCGSSGGSSASSGLCARQHCSQQPCTSHCCRSIASEAPWLHSRP